jgi:hypothetical protein
MEARSRLRRTRRKGCTWIRGPLSDLQSVCRGFAGSRVRATTQLAVRATTQLDKPPTGDDVKRTSLIGAFSRLHRTPMTWLCPSAHPADNRFDRLFASGPAGSAPRLLPSRRAHSACGIGVLQVRHPRGLTQMRSGLPRGWPPLPHSAEGGTNVVKAWAL